MEWEDYKHGFAEVAICFDKQDKGRRYTDTSAEAKKEHSSVLAARNVSGKAFGEAKGLWRME